MHVNIASVLYIPTPALYCPNTKLLSLSWHHQIILFHLNINPPFCLKATLGCISAVSLSFIDTTILRAPKMWIFKFYTVMHQLHELELGHAWLQCKMSWPGDRGAKWRSIFTLRRGQVIKAKAPVWVDGWILCNSKTMDIITTWNVWLATLNITKFRNPC